MKIYISGPISGMPDGNRAAFEAAEKAVQDAGHDPVNPHNNGVADGATWAQHMRTDIVMMLGCDAVLMLAGWQKSKGACFESWIADHLDVPVFFSIDQLPHAK